MLRHPDGQRVRHIFQQVQHAVSTCVDVFFFWLLLVTFLSDLSFDTASDPHSSHRRREIHLAACHRVSKARLFQGHFNSTTAKSIHHAAHSVRLSTRTSLVCMILRY